jgi:ribonuclease P protein component
VRWYGRLRRSNEIAFVRRRGRQASLSCLVAYVVPSQQSESTVAVTVAKTVGGAVVRNRVRRRIRGALDALTPPALAQRLLFVAKPAAAQASYEHLAAEVERALARLSASR